MRVAETPFVEKSAHLPDALCALGEAAIADDADIAEVGAELRRQREGNVEPVGRQKSGRAVGPFQEHHGALREVVEAELGKLRGAGKPV